MSIRQISCPTCGEEDQLTGQRHDTEIRLTCGACGQEWTRQLSPECSNCGGSDLQTVPVAMVEKSRGTQLSVVGIRHVDMCWVCDRETIERWQDNRPNPLFPTELPTVPTAEEMNRGDESDR